MSSNIEEYSQVNPWFENDEIDDISITSHNNKGITSSEVRRCRLCVGYWACHKSQLEPTQHIEERVEPTGIEVHRAQFQQRK